MSADSRSGAPHRLRRALLLAVICILVSGFGLFLARPIAAQFRHSSPWILPAIAVAVLTTLAILALVVLPRLPGRRP
jgi:hypothetical protein